MIVLQILGVIGLVLLVLLAIVLLLPMRFLFFTDRQGKIKVNARVLFFVLGKNPGASRNFADQWKRLLLGDRFVDADAVKSAVGDDGVKATVRAALELVENMRERVAWLLTKCRVRRLVFHVAVGDEDAAVAAIEYGFVSTAVYSMVGVIDTHMKVDDGALDVDVVCDFQKNRSSLKMDVSVSVCIFWILLALIKLISQNKKNNQHKK